ncbi:hypothetical protein [Curvibacter sp. PAE-UM]|uniref:hypothetical protein n=1 Tax=Curvibacter sp. PAE-UM TaxID=1714344 RepID=UPI0012E33B60|nr:hypothetical protein [Curvibacter sp. PAE-UM]
MKKTERVVLYYDLKITASSRTFDGPAPISVKKAISLMELVPKEHRAMRRARGSQTIYISDWQRHGNTVKILINKSDKSLADPVFSVPTKSSRRVARKRSDEGQDFSSHVVIKFPQDTASPALMLVEQCPGLNAIVIADLFRRVLRLAKDISPKDFQQIHPDGSLDSDGLPLKYSVFYGAELDGHLSPTFVEDLNRGEMRTVELITNKKTRNDFDTTGYLVEDKASIVLKVSPTALRPADVATHVLNFVKGKSKDFSLAKIRFKEPDSSNERTVTIDPDVGVAENYVKRDLLTNFEQLLESSYASLHDEIIKKMLYLAR